MLEIDDELLLDIRAGGLADLRIAYRPSFLDEMLAAETGSGCPEAFQSVPRRRRRKPSLDRLLAKAKAAGATSVVVDGAVRWRAGRGEIRQSVGRRDREAHQTMTRPYVQALRGYHYFRRAGFPRVKLPGQLMSPEFMAAYQEAMALAPAPIGASKIKPDTVAAAVGAHRCGRP
jgi:hypothetical protein